MLAAELYPYQRRAFDAMVARRRYLLVWDMGLGKTVVALAAIEELLGRRDADMAVIIVPATLCWQWAKAVARLTDTDNRTVRVKGRQVIVPVEQQLLIVSGSQAARQQGFAKAAELRPDYVVMSYATAVAHLRQVKALRPGIVVLDEAHAIKGFSSQRSKMLKRLQPPHRIALTATPLKKGRPEEIYSIMQWVDDAVLGRWDLFDRSFVIRAANGMPVGYRNLDLLHGRLSEAMDRRTQDDPDVAPYLPRREHRRVSVRLDALTRAAYGRVSDDLLDALERAAGKQVSLDLAGYYAGRADKRSGRGAGEIGARLTAAQMLLDHPDLLRASAAAHAQGTGGSAYAARLAADGVLEDLSCAPKLQALRTVVTGVLSQNPAAKVIVFARFRATLPLIEAAFPELQAVTFRGGMTDAAREAALTRFTSDPACRLFLSTEAGGTGLDLPQASHIVNFSLPESHGDLAQRNSRHVRASSTWEHVEVIDLICPGTIEDRRADRLELEGRTAAAVLDNTGADDHGRIDRDVPSLHHYLAA
jgi:SNF2 family DNA or RNA helicase